MPNPDPYLRPSVGNQRDVYLYPSAPDTGGGPNLFGNIAGTIPVNGSVTGTWGFSGTITGTSTVTGTVTGRVGKAGFFAGSIEVVGTETGSVGFSGAINSSIEIFGFVGGQEHNFGSVAGQIPVEGTVNGFNPEEEPAPEPLRPGRAFRPRGVRRTHRAGKVRGRIEVIGCISGQKRIPESTQFHTPTKKITVPVVETLPVDTRWLEEEELVLAGFFD